MLKCVHVVMGKKVLEGTLEEMIDSLGPELRRCQEYELYLEASGSY